MRFINSFLLHCLCIFIASILMVNCGTGNNSSNRNEYYDNGQVRIEKIINGDSAIWKFKHEDGTCWEENYYFKDEKYKVIQFYPNCKKQLEYELKNGKRHGKWEAYYESGKVSEAGRYDNGLATGIFQYYNESGQTTYYHLYITSDWANSAEPLGLSLSAIKTKLESVDLKVDDDVKVAGNKKYYFPVARWGKSELLFNEKTGNDSTIICRGGSIADSGFVIMNKIEIGIKALEFFEILGLDTDEGCKELTIYSTKEPYKEFKFVFDNKTLQKVIFGIAEIRN